MQTVKAAYGQYPYHMLMVTFLALVLHGCFHAAPLAAAERAQRIVSINACTDELLFKIADRSQIAALSFYAGDPAYSIYAGEVKAAGIRLIRGSAEEVLKLKPDLVLAGTWTRRVTRALLKARGIPLALFGPGDSVAAAIDNIERVAHLTGNEDRGAKLITQINAALAAAPHFRSRDHPITVLQMQRRGFTSGSQTLVGDLLRRLGVVNAADQLGITHVAQMPLEAVLKLHADALIVQDTRQEANDQGAALLLHPVLMTAYPPARRLVLPHQLTNCGGPATAQAIRTLSRGLRQLPQ